MEPYQNKEDKSLDRKTKHITLPGLTLFVDEVGSNTSQQGGQKFVVCGAPWVLL
jgi:hypothetical protein